MTSTVEHPAKFSGRVLDAIRKELDDRHFKGTILDPFAGVGKVHDLAVFGERFTRGVELEPEWAATHYRTEVGDATALGFQDEEFDAVITSPPFGNRMADNYAGDLRGTRRYTYRIALGRSLSDDSAAGMQWGTKYRDTMLKALNEIWRVLKPGGLFLLNISDHIRKGELQQVPYWYGLECKTLGFTLEKIVPVDTPRMGHGQNHLLRADSEFLYVLTKP